MTSHWMKQQTLLALNVSILKIRSDSLPIPSVIYDKKSLLLAFRIRKDGCGDQVVLYPNVSLLLLPYNGAHVAVGYNGRFSLQRPSYYFPIFPHERLQAEDSGRFQAPFKFKWFVTPHILCINTVRKHCKSLDFRPKVQMRIADHFLLGTRLPFVRLLLALNSAPSRLPALCI